MENNNKQAEMQFNVLRALTEGDVVLNKEEIELLEEMYNEALEHNEPDAAVKIRMEYDNQKSKQVAIDKSSYYTSKIQLKYYDNGSHNRYEKLITNDRSRPLSKDEVSSQGLTPFKSTKVRSAKSLRKKSKKA